MSSSTKGYARHRITPSGVKQDDRELLRGSPGRAFDLHKPEWVGLQFGWARVVSPHLERKNGRLLLRVVCVGCHEEKLVAHNNLLSGKTNGCQNCSQPRRLPKKLDRRLTAAKQRCSNPDSPVWESYGGRGIEFRFSSVLEAGLWIMSNLGWYPEQELDRIDNDGHYEAGNLRWATRAQQNSNKRTSKLPEGWKYNPELWPYAENTVKRKLREGKTQHEILREAERAVQEKRKGWRSIRDRLASMTS